MKSRNSLLSHVGKEWWGKCCVVRGENGKVPKFLLLYQLLYIHVQGFIDKNNVLYSQRYGFRKNYSTTQTLLDISQKIMEYALDKGEYACGIFIDLQKAFDTVDHAILFEKLFH